jgi:hypothetical protein
MRGGYQDLLVASPVNDVLMLLHGGDSDQPTNVGGLPAGENSADVEQPEEDGNQEAAVADYQTHRLCSALGSPG